MDAITSLTLISLATFRLSYMLVNEAGPFNVFGYLRAWSRETVVTVDADGTPHTVTQPRNELGRLLECPYCASVWCAIWFTLLWTVTPGIVFVGAVAGVAFLLIDLVQDDVNTAFSPVSED